MTDSLIAYLAQLIGVSRHYGSDPAFVLAGGGNTSYKTVDRLWVKASGHSLATIDAGGFVELDRAKLDAMLHATWPADANAREAAFIEAVMASRVHPELGQRPSVEALLHHLLPSRFVVHTHPGLVNALTCCLKGRELTKELFADRVLWQPYVDPGLILAKELASSINHHRASVGRDPAAIFLANHGLIVAGDTTEAIETETAHLVARLQERIDLAGPPTTRPAMTMQTGFLDTYARALAVERDGLVAAEDSSAAAAILASTPALCDIALMGPLTPDQIVYCRSVPIYFESPTTDMPAAIDQWRGKWDGYVVAYGWEPWVAIIAGAGLIAFRNNAKLSDVTRAVYTDAARVYDYARRLGGVRILDVDDRRFIENWEVEAYRRAVMCK